MCLSLVNIYFCFFYYYLFHWADGSHAKTFGKESSIVSATTTRCRTGIIREKIAFRWFRSIELGGGRESSLEGRRDENQ